MKNIKKFTVKNATITIYSATTLQFNHNNCFQIESPYIFATAYKCGDYILLHELQGFLTDEVIEPKTSNEFQKRLHTKNNPFYLDVYDSLYDSLFLEKDALKGYDLFNRLDAYKNESLECFHLFKVDDTAWNEIELNLKNMNKKNLLEWDYFASGMVNFKH